VRPSSPRRWPGSVCSKTSSGDAAAVTPKLAGRQWQSVVPESEKLPDVGTAGYATLSVGSGADVNPLWCAQRAASVRFETSSFR
jgi:hypothetical protein